MMSAKNQSSSTMDDDHTDDYALALQLQLEWEEEEKADIVELGECSNDSDAAMAALLQKEWNMEKQGAGPSDLNSSMGIVDERWELIDPSPDIRALFLQFNDKFFWGKLSGCEVRWSPRMTLCAGLCCYEGRGGLCSIRLSSPLLKLRPRKDLVETLLHEMIHGLLFITDNNKDHDGHGPEFCKHMQRINKETGTNISIYHSFHEEVDLYRQHWWRCSGCCQQKKPYFGFVKRAMNRAPGPRDPWWGEHERTCGGTYTKVKEPEGYGQKKTTSKKTTTSNESQTSKATDISRFFGSGTTGSVSNSKDNPPQNVTHNKANIADNDKVKQTDIGNSNFKKRKGPVVITPDDFAGNKSNITEDNDKNNSTDSSSKSTATRFIESGTTGLSSNKTDKSVIDKTESANMRNNVINARKRFLDGLEDKNKSWPATKKLKTQSVSKGLLGGQRSMDAFVKQTGAKETCAHIQKIDNSQQNITKMDNNKRYVKTMENESCDKKSSATGFTATPSLSKIGGAVEQTCPVCQRLVPPNNMNSHLDSCLQC